MSHKAQQDFCLWVRDMYPQYFNGKVVIDIGSLDINGSNRQYFKKCEYTGVDIIAGKNVDRIGRAHELLPEIGYNTYFNNVERQYEKKPRVETIISTEALEHDVFYRETLHAMYYSLVPRGLMIITAAGEGRQEHGTSNHSPADSPATNDYYKNISNEMFAEVLPPELFDVYFLRQINCDLQFFGIKR
jgi:hypothetical protein